MSALPLRTRPVANAQMLCVNDNGRFFAADTGFAKRLAANALEARDTAFLGGTGHLVGEDALAQAAHAYAIGERLGLAGPLDYLILVPTLRCNLNCSYCQVSRAPEASAGFDWSAETLAAVLARIGALPGERIKVEFQGGEPTLRPDLIRAVIAACERFAEHQFVICTNLQKLDDEILEIFAREDVFISTSLDGDAALHGANRTGSDARTAQFLANLRHIIDRFGPEKASALPTIDATAPPEPELLLDSYTAHGFRSIFLRPINYQGFARKRHQGSREQDGAWRAYYRRFVEHVIARNWADRDQVIEETYLSICLRRIFQPGRDRHVDLRNPNPVGQDYVVIDYDGRVYPTDEARMLTRSGVIDLAIGDIHAGWDSEKRDQLNAHATNQFDPACSRCAYQPFCGRDLIDDLSRYGRIDLPRTDTEFCRKHLHLFDLIFELVYSDDPAVHYSLSRWLGLPATATRFGTVHA